VQVPGTVTPDANSTCAGSEFPCTAAVLAAGDSTVIEVDFEVSTGEFCNEATVEWADPMATSAEVCTTVIPPFNGLVKGTDIDGDSTVDFPAQGEDTILSNLWICVDHATDGVDNDGDSTVDNEDETCENKNEQALEIGEYIFSSEDCDTRNDDDDLDGLPINGPSIYADEDGVDNDGDTVVDNDGELAAAGSNGLDDDDDGFVDELDEAGLDDTTEVANPGFNEGCPLPTLQDYVDGLVDKDGGEEPEGLGAFEFQLKFDHKIFDIEIEAADPNEDNNGDTVVDELDDWANGRITNCSMTIITENDIRFGCVTVGDSPLGHAQVSGILGASITVSPEADLIFRLRPGKDNGVVRRLLDENCEIADIFGDIFPDTNAGLTQDCTDVDVTVRRLEGDIDADCTVGVLDAQRIAFRYGSFFGQLLFNQVYDLEPFVTGDFDIDIKDLQFVFGRDGSTCADPVPNNQDPQSAEGVGQP
jgi:hypothetical protein